MFHAREIPPTIVVEAILIMAWKFLLLPAPLFAVAALWWIVNRTDQIIHYLFPNLEWERSLGWLNIRAERQARTALRWLGYGAYLLLASALLGIVWSVKGLQETGNWLDPWAIGLTMLRFGIIAVSLGAWVLYLGLWLKPKLRAQREEAELRQFRAEMAEAEAEEERRRNVHGPSRVKMPLQKPRQNTPPAKTSDYDIFTDSRTRRRQ